MQGRLVVVAVSIFLISLAFMDGHLANANPEVYASMAKIQIIIPVEGFTYNTNPVSFVMKGEIMQRYFVNHTTPYFYCNLDGYDFIVNATFEENTSDGWMVFSGKIKLSDLANGQHSVSVRDISNSQIARALNPVTVSFNIANSKSSINPIAPEFTVQFGGDLPPNKWTKFTVPYANFTIKNPQFPTHTPGGQKISFTYHVRWKEHSDTSWIHYTIPVSATDSNYTFYALMLVHGEGPEEPHASGQADFQVAARAASITANSVFISQLSDWSDTQTITLAADSNYSSPTPSVPELPIAFLPLFLGITMITITVLLKKTNLKMIN
jgi:hypothetical protein